MSKHEPGEVYRDTFLPKSKQWRFQSHKGPWPCAYPTKKAAGVAAASYLGIKTETPITASEAADLIARGKHADESAAKVRAKMTSTFKKGDWVSCGEEGDGRGAVSMGRVVEGPYMRTDMGHDGKPTPTYTVDFDGSYKLAEASDLKATTANRDPLTLTNHANGIVTLHDGLTGEGLFKGPRSILASAAVVLAAAKFAVATYRVVESGPDAGMALVSRETLDELRAAVDTANVTLDQITVLAAKKGVR